MATYEDGYRQALVDARNKVQMLAGQPGLSVDGMAELFGVVLILEKMIKHKAFAVRENGGEDAVEEAARHE